MADGVDQAPDPFAPPAALPDEFFYLDGEVTLTNNERGADYNITATPKTWDEVTADITTPPPGGRATKGWVRYGLVRDTGDDGAPAPQCLTHEKPADPAQAPTDHRGVKQDRRPVHDARDEPQETAADGCTAEQFHARAPSANSMGWRDRLA